MCTSFVYHRARINDDRYDEKIYRFLAARVSITWQSVQTRIDDRDHSVSCAEAGLTNVLPQIVLSHMH